LLRKLRLCRRRQQAARQHDDGQSAKNVVPEFHLSPRLLIESIFNELL
jgi:hypothetical protein